MAVGFQVADVAKIYASTFEVSIADVSSVADVISMLLFAKVAPFPISIVMILHGFPV